MPNNNLQDESKFEEVETKLKGTEITYICGKDASKITPEMLEKANWRKYTQEEWEELEEQLNHFAYLNSLVRKPIIALVEGTGLTQEEAKTVVYWALATHGLDVLDIFALLALYGKPGTGKSTILQIISKLVDAEFLSTTTPAAFRDQLAKHRIVLIEEGDSVNEELILKRYSKQSSVVEIKDPSNIGYLPVSGSIYGATVLHKRYSFEELALQSRCITIETKGDKIRSDAKDFCTIPLDDTDKDGLKEVWDDAWSRFSHYQVSGRTANNWRPLIIVALALGDSDWIRYANEMQNLSKNELIEDGEFEPEQLVAYAVDYLKATSTSPAEFILLSDIIHHLESTYMYKPSAKRTAKILRGLGYKGEHHREGFGVVL
jgi:hypothetical protein